LLDVLAAMAQAKANFDVAAEVYLALFSPSPSIFLDTA
jgi:hypothetical protein